MLLKPQDRVLDDRQEGIKHQCRQGRRPCRSGPGRRSGGTRAGPGWEPSGAPRRRRPRPLPAAAAAPPGCPAARPPAPRARRPRRPGRDEPPWPRAATTIRRSSRLNHSRVTSSPRLPSRRPRRRGRTRGRSRFAGLSRNAAAGPSCTSPPSCIRARRSPRRQASRMSWVTSTTVLPSRRWSPRNSSCSSRRVIGSRAPKGSSIRIRSELAASARATPTRCRWPPLSWRGNSGPNRAGSSPTSSSREVASACCSRSRLALHPGRQCDVVQDRKVRHQPPFLDHVADRPPQRDRVPLGRATIAHQTRPDEGSISALTIFSKVVLPDPLVPRRARISPLATLRAHASDGLMTAGIDFRDAFPDHGQWRRVRRGGHETWFPFESGGCSPAVTAPA